jgi:hypothetical protein
LQRAKLQNRIAICRTTKQNCKKQNYKAESLPEKTHLDTWKYKLEINFEENKNILSLFSIENRILLFRLKQNSAFHT